MSNQYKVTQSSYCHPAETGDCGYNVESLYKAILHERVCCYTEYQHGFDSVIGTGSQVTIVLQGRVTADYYLFVYWITDQHKYIYFFVF